MIRFLSSSLLVLGLLSAGPALAQDTQGFDFDFDQQKNETATTIPPDASREPIAAPARATEKTAPAAAAASAPIPPAVPAPVIETNIASPVTRDKDGVIVVIGQPDPPAQRDQTMSEDELYDLFAAPETAVILSPEGLPPTTSVPAGPGEARVEIVREVRSTASKVLKKTEPTASPGKKITAKQTTISDLLVKLDDLDYRRWYLAQRAWSLVGSATSPKTAALWPDSLLDPVERATSAKAQRAFVDRHSTWQTTAAVEVTRVP